MNDIFQKFIEMSIAAGWMTLAVMILRVALKKMPRSIICIMWGLVGVRLLCPISFESILSLIPARRAIYVDRTAPVQTAVPLMDVIIPFDNLAQSAQGVQSAQNVWTWLPVVIWLAGVTAMLTYLLISCLRVYSRVREAAYLRENILTCDGIGTCFILGVFRPRIYMDSRISAEDAELVIAHERAHLRRLDHVWKPLGFLILALHWFNPLVWLAYVLLCRDIELACDEKVIKQLGVDIKKPYSEALVNCSVPRKTIAACPLAFGEVGVKTRIKNVLNYKKPAFWIIIVSLVLLVAVAVCFLTDPLAPVEYDFSGEISERQYKFVDKIIQRENVRRYSRARYRTYTYEVLGTAKQGNELTVYAIVTHGAYDLKDGQVTVEQVVCEPTVIRLEDYVASYRTLEYITASGDAQAKQVRKLFPEQLWEKVGTSLYGDHADILYGYAQSELANNKYCGVYSDGSSWFRAELLMMEGDVLTFKPALLAREATVSDVMTVNIADVPDDKLAQLRVGSIYVVYYDGIAEELSGGIIPNVTEIGTAVRSDPAEDAASLDRVQRTTAGIKFDIDGDGAEDDIIVMGRSLNGVCFGLSVIMCSDEHSYMAVLSEDVYKVELQSAEDGDLYIMITVGAQDGVCRSLKLEWQGDVFCLREDGETVATAMEYKSILGYRINGERFQLRVTDSNSTERVFELTKKQ